MNTNSIRLLIILILSALSAVFTSSFADSASADPPIEIFNPAEFCIQSDSMDRPLAGAWEPCNEQETEQREQIVSFVGTALWTSFSDVEVYENVAFVTGLNGFQIFDISNAAAPVLVKHVPLGGSEYNRTHLDGSILYIGRNNYLHIYDVSDPLNPQPLCQRGLTGIVREIKVNDNRAYVGIGRVSSDYSDTPALFIFDVTDPANPVSIGKYESPWGRKGCREFTIVGDYIYGCSYWDRRIDVISISDETRPEYVTHFTADYPSDVVYHDSYIYIAERYSRMQIYDVSTPDAPVLSDSSTIPCETMEIHQDKLFTELGGEISAYEFQPSGKLRLLGSHECLYSKSIAFSDTLMLIPLKAYGVEIDNISDLSDITKISRYRSPIHKLKGIDVSGDYSYVVNSDSYVGEDRNGVHVVDISDKQNPAHVCRVQTGGNPAETFVHDELLFVSKCWETKILTLLYPDNPVFISEVAENTYDNIARNNILYISGAHDGLLVADIANPHYPTIISQLDIAGDAVLSVLLSGDIAYAMTDTRLWTVDISNPSNISLIDRLSVGEGPFGGSRMAKYGNHLFFADGINGLLTIDLSNPLRPDVIDCYNPGGPTYRDVIVERNLMIIAYSSRFRSIDISDPLNWESIQYVQLPSPVMRLKVKDGYLYVNSLCGLYIYDFQLPPVECGDVNGSENVDIDDVVWLIAYIFSGGPAPVPIESADVNCSGSADIDDVVWLICYIFSGGYAPCDTDGDGQPDC